MSGTKRSKRVKVPRFFLVAFNEDDTIKFCVMEKSKILLPEGQDCAVGTQVKVRWQDNNEYQGKVFGMNDDKNELKTLEQTLFNYQSFSEKAFEVSKQPADFVSKPSQNISSKELEDNKDSEEFENQDPDSQLSEYEKKRKANMERNNEILDQLGLLVQDKPDQSITCKSGPTLIPVTDIERGTCTSSSTESTAKMENNGFHSDKVKFLQSSMFHYVTRMEVLRFLMNQIFTQEELKTCSVWGKCISKNKAAKPMLPAEKRSLLFKLLKVRFPEELRTDQECGLAANDFLKRIPGRK